MAFSVMIEVIKFPHDLPMLRLDPNWWNPKDLISDERFKYTNETGSYADYTACLSKQEFLDLLNKYRHAAEEPFHDSKETRAELAILDHIVDLIDDEHDTIRVTAYEWESGYD